jgi:lysophospholipase L1-like esterase
MKSLYGFTKPYNFARALPFLTAIALLFLIFCVMGTFALFSNLSWGTYRFAYFLYLGALAIAGAALSFAPRLAWPLVALCFIEFSLGVSTTALQKLGIWERNVLPGNIQIENPVLLPEFKYHPLLQAVPKPNFLRSAPFPVQHNSYGLRGTERESARLKKQTVIAAVGGSTTYGYGVAEGQPWPDALERKLGPEYAVLNYGVLAYSTVEHVIQTALYLNAFGVRPQCAIYYVGWNDIRNAHIPHLDAGYADFHLLSKFDVVQVRKIKTPLLAIEVSPLVRILSPYIPQLEVAFDTVPLPKRLTGIAPQQGSDLRLENLFRTNVESIAAINKQRGITSVFVGQVLNRATLTGTAASDWVPLVRQIDVWPLQARFNAVLKETADALNSPAFIPPIDEFNKSDFIDDGHFSPQGGEKFAAMLAPLVQANCKTTNSPVTTK